MRRKTLFITSAVFLTGIILLGLAIMLLSKTGSSYHAEQKLEAFENIQLSVLSADVSIVEGNEYSIAYHLHDREKIRQLTVRDNTLYFDTGIDFLWRPGHRQKYSVLITIPKDAVLSEMTVSSTAGDILIGDKSFQNGSFSTTSGNIAFSGIHCENLTAKSVSHGISLADSVILEEAFLKTVSGKIQVDSPFQSIQAKSIGKISLDGKRQGGRLSIGTDAPLLRAESVSGHIRLTTPTTP